MCRGTKRLILLLFLVFTLVGCGKSSSEGAESNEGQKYKTMPSDSVESQGTQETEDGQITMPAEVERAKAVEMNRTDVECANGIISYVMESITYDENVAEYKIYQEKDHTETDAELTIEQSGDSYLYTLCLSDSFGNLLQTLVWNSNFLDYLEFVDVNMDGYIDIKAVMYEWTRCNSYTLYVWDADQQQYVEVIYDNAAEDDVIGDIEIYDGYLLNRLGGIVQKLVWDETHLTKVFEDYYQADEDEIVTTYEDETQDIIQFQTLNFSVSPTYHVVRKTDYGAAESYDCERNEDSIAQDKEFTFTIHETIQMDFKELGSIISYFDYFDVAYNEILVYTNVLDESGIESMYVALSDDVSYYLIYLEDRAYFIQADYDRLYNYLFESVPEENYRLKQETINCANGITSNVAEVISYQERLGDYVIDQEKDGTEINAHLSITESEDCYQYTLLFSDIYGNNIQTLYWDSYFLNYPEFVDVNMDGYIDIQTVLYEWVRCNSHAFYVWDASQQQYMEVVYENASEDDILGEIEIYDGYLINRMDEYVQKLEWNGNHLVKVSEEICLPDE